MIPSERANFNQAFTEEKYIDFLHRLEKDHGRIPFRVAETPVFIPEALKEKLIAAGEEIISFIQRPDFKVLTDRAIPTNWSVPSENDHPHFLTFDFGICQDAHGEFTPMLIEMQGFPSLYGFQAQLAEAYKEAYSLDENFSPYFNGLTREKYITLLKKVIVGEHLPEEIALMDVDALEQKTAIDFFITHELTGIKILSLHEIYREGRRLFYNNGDEKVFLKRIYNRLIFDEIEKSTGIFKEGFDPREDLDIEWITHPNWFYRVSKFTMPFLRSQYVPKTFFLNEVIQIPADLENYVLKPLFSFAGQGVIIDVTSSDITDITDPENWILQEKVEYVPAVMAPDGGIKVEIRLMYLWADNEQPELCINLARLSRGKMIGVRYNKDFDWVGGTIGLMK